METEISGLILLDNSGTLKKMKLEEVEGILASAAKANCKVVIATGGTSKFDDSLEHLSNIGLPQGKWPEVWYEIEKNDIGIYKAIAERFSLSTDRIILIDDAARNVACAGTAGVQALLFDGSKRPSICQLFVGERILNRDFSPSNFDYLPEEYGPARPSSEALGNILSKLVPTLPNGVEDKPGDLKPVVK